MMRGFHEDMGAAGMGGMASVKPSQRGDALGDKIALQLLITK